MLIQLPNDVISQGYKQTKTYHYEQVFHSPSNNFTGAELEFVIAGLGYRYVQIDAHSRRELPI